MWWNGMLIERKPYVVIAAMLKIYEPHHEKTCFVICEQHPRSLFSTFVVHCLDSIIPLVSISEISSLYLASVAAQTCLSLTWLETLKTGFSRGVAHIEKSIYTIIMQVKPWPDHSYCLDVHFRANKIVAVRDGAYSLFNTSKVTEGFNPIPMLKVGIQSLSKWATSLQNQQNDLCVKRRLRSAWASTQSDQSLCCTLSG